MKLKVVLMEEAAAFIAGQSVKAQQKIYIIYSKLKKALGKQRYSRNLKIRIYGSSGLYTMAFVIGFSPFGIQIRTRW